MNNIKISIVTITYNSEETVEQTIKSVIGQNYDNLEYIIIDGGSTDRTMEIVNSYKDSIAVIVSEPDKGISDAFNKGIFRASGDIIGIINSDDMLSDGALAIVAENYEHNTEVYFGNAIIWDDKTDKKHILKSSAELKKMDYGFDIVHPSTFVSREAYKKYGVFSLKYKCAMDYDLLLRFYKAGAKFKYIDENLSVFRLGGTNQVMRSRTIKEVRDSSIENGGKAVIAYGHYYKKIIIDKIRPVLKKLNINIVNKRVAKI